VSRTFFILLFLFPLILIGQDCKCIQDKIQLCFTRSQDYCETSSSICGYSLDGGQMQNALRRKLLNPSLFGPDGIQDCSINIGPLPKNPSRADIVESGCKMIFIGNHGVSGPTLENQSEVSTEALETIYNWSLECESNLVIVTQAEAIPWGYMVDNVNQNPNSSSGDANPIFNGPFGNVQNYNQGGTFQANFISFPETEYDIIGQDRNGRPTIIWDKASNDILLADVGILCSGAGDVSFGPNIINNNDRLACNIFAFGCSIADNRIFEFENITLCDGETFTLPNNDEVSEETFFIDTLIASNNCDSFVVYNIDVGVSTEAMIVDTHCESDNIVYTISGIVYDKNNPVGTEVIRNTQGCDSTITIDLTYLPNDSLYIEEIICYNEQVEFDGNLYNPGQVYEIRYPSSLGCDSIVQLDLKSFPDLGQIEADAQLIQQFETSNISIPEPENAEIQWESIPSLNCYNCFETEFYPGIVYPETIEYYITDTYGCTYRYELELEYDCQPIIPNIFSPNSQLSNTEFEINTDCPLDDYNLIIFDRWGSEVFKTNDPNTHWNGKKYGQLSPSGVYVYNLSYSNDRQSNNTIVGSITLIH